MKVLRFLTRVWVPPSDVPSTRVGQESILAVSPFRKIWWRKRTVSELRKMELIIIQMSDQFYLWLGSDWTWPRL